MEHTLAAGRMSHEDNLAVAVAEFGGLVVLDISYTLHDLIGVSVEVSKAPGLIGGSEI